MSDPFDTLDGPFDSWLSWFVHRTFGGTVNEEQGPRDLDERSGPTLTSADASSTDAALTAQSPCSSLTVLADWRKEQT